jgi:hypothetical protein
MLVVISMGKGVELLERLLIVSRAGSEIPAVRGA